MLQLKLTPNRGDDFPRQVRLVTYEAPRFVHDAAGATHDEQALVAVPGPVERTWEWIARPKGWSFECTRWRRRTWRPREWRLGREWPRNMEPAVEPEWLRCDRLLAAIDAAQTVRPLRKLCPEEAERSAHYLFSSERGLTTVTDALYRNPEQEMAWVNANPWEMRDVPAMDCECPHGDAREDMHDSTCPAA